MSGRSAGDTGVTRPLIVGVAGGSGSGKTTVVERIVTALVPRPVARVQHDAYYHDYAHLEADERAAVNFDHPDALDTDLLVRHLDDLADGHAIQVPRYDFATHRRTGESDTVERAPVVIVDGILVLAEPELRTRMDVKIFVDTAPDLRFMRRMQRDLAERDRSLESVVAQYEETVRPMHLEFVEPSKRYADVIVPRGGENHVAIRMVVNHIRSFIGTP